MSPLDRRTFLGAAAVAPLMGTAIAAEKPALALAPFRFDVTPPKGNPLLGGWIKPVEAVDDSLEAIGFVLTGSGKPIVICAVDWAGIMNEAHVAWRTALADAAGTTPDRVAVQCVHQHNTPFVCLDAEKAVAAHADLPHIMDLDFFKTCLERGRKAIADGLKKARPVTHIATGKGKVEKVAANRRVHRDADGKVLAMRGSSCKDAKLRDLPEGTIDPWLRTVAFYEKDQKLAACHYYASHPMSYYGDGRVSSDFPGLARKQRQAEEPDCLHIYFTGCAGNVAAGKYNDGSKENRPVLTKRIYEAIVAAEKELRPEPVTAVAWKTHELMSPAREEWTAEKLTSAIGDAKAAVSARNISAYKLAWLKRAAKKAPPIVLSALHLNDATLLHLPAEVFVEYQLRAHDLAPKKFVACAAYGDGGPWYIPTKDEFPGGGYEVSVAFCGPEVDTAMTTGIRDILG